MRTTAEPSTSRIEIVRHNETTWYSINRAGPSYGEGNDYVYKEVLGLSTDDIESLRADEVI